MKDYKKRIADKILADKLEAMGAVLIEGPLWKDNYCKYAYKRPEDGVLVVPIGSLKD